MADLTKVVLNKEVVMMRKCIQKARQQLINKLLKSVRKLKGGKSNGENQEKTAKKVEKIMLEIYDMKKSIKLDEVSKYALVNTEPFSQATRKCSVKERVIAKLADHKVVKDAVAAFRLKYPNWDVQVRSLYNIWAFQKKFKMLGSWDTKQNTNVLLPNTATVKTVQPLIARESSASEGNFDDTDDEEEMEVQRQVASSSEDEDGFEVQERASSSEKDSDEEFEVRIQATTSEGAKKETNSLKVDLNPIQTAEAAVESIESVSSSESRISSKSPAKKVMKTRVVSGKKVKTLDARKEKQKANKKKRNELGVKRIERTEQKVEMEKMTIEKMLQQKNKGEMEVRRINLSDFDDGEREIPVRNVSDTTDNTKHRVKSSFFLDSDEEQQPDDEHDRNRSSHQKHETEKKRFGSSYGQRRQQERGGRFGKTTGPRNRSERRKLMREQHHLSEGSEQNPNITVKTSESKIQDALARLCSQKYMSHEIDKKSEKLHPSWEAKKKANEQKAMVAFQGKKITFDD